MKRKGRHVTKVRVELLRAASHHLTNYLSLVVSVGGRAVEHAETPAAANEARKRFAQLFEEVATTAAALSEGADGPTKAATSRSLEAIREMPGYREMQASANVAGGYVYEDAERVPSVMLPGELAWRVRLARDCEDFGSWLLNYAVVVNGAPFLVLAVEYDRTKPIKAGDAIVLVVRSIDANDKVASHPEGDSYGRESESAVDAGGTPDPAGAAQDGDSGATDAGAAAAPDGSDPAVRAAEGAR